MKYNININQKALSELAELKGVKLDLIDGAIINWIKDFHNEPKVKKIEINGKKYFWISYKFLLNDMPLIGIKSKGALSMRLKKIIDLGLLEKYFDLEGGSLTYFYCTQDFYDLERDKRGSFEKEGVHFEKRGGSLGKEEGFNSKNVGGSLGKVYNHNTINHNTNNITNINKKEVFVEDSFEFKMASNFYINHLENNSVTLLSKLNDGKTKEDIIQDFAIHIEKLKRIDNISEEVIEKVLNFLYSHSKKNRGKSAFCWLQQIQTTKKLRDKNKEGVKFFFILAEQASLQNTNLDSNKRNGGVL